MSAKSYTCQINKKYSWIECVNPVLNGDPDGYCILHSQNPDKDPEAFRAALRARWEQSDAERYDFSGVFFPGPFIPGNFFDSREFTKPAYFYGATFTQEAYFFGATFTQNASFLGATFTQKANFSQATFTQGAHFSGATFTQKADFSGANILGRLIFRLINPPQEGDPPPFQADFNGLALGSGVILRFQDLSLAHAEFAGSDLRQLEFHHVQWHPYRGRQAIYDEVLLRQGEKKEPWFWTWLLYHAPYADPPSSWTDDYGEVERLYRELQENYEKARDYKKMGDFHYGEMEMHRRANKWRWFPFFWYNLYWALSGYGERPSRAFVWLAAFLAIFTGLLAWAGLEILDAKHSASFGNPFFYLLQKVTLQRPTWAEPVGFGGKLVAGLSLLLIPGQAALFLLALRNRLGRRR